MASEYPFEIKEHKVEAQHIREYPNATAHSQEEVLYLSVKQYIPKNNPSPKPGDVTIIASHANGFVKELYEPLWEDLLKSLNQRSVGVRGIWIADVAWQGRSGIINEDNLGNDSSWHDHARDLLHLINTFRASMVRPLIGIGHSFGGNIIVNLALMHPRLLSSLVLLDPVLSRFKHRPNYGFTPMINSARRRDLWPSREAATSSFARSPFYSTWDPRCLALWNQYGLRPTPTALYPSAPEPSVTLTTTKHMECFTYYRPQAQSYAPDGTRTVDKSLLIDADPEIIASDPTVFPFYRPEGTSAVSRLASLRPGALWLFGETSDVNPPDVRTEKMELTGVGVGGSGGAAKGRVKQVVVEGFGHLVPMEATTRCADAAGEFIAGDLTVWRKEEELFRQWTKKTRQEKQELDEDWWKWMGGKGKREVKGKL
ncbi:Alpha/beta hydrolase family-domain-containing protein [Immersiella caudata]|uniref:Alpha/beta hydrolase family-domain-containing protein n=1 Tax=Immersiella caudata TaxID=314043 RepID=A0AA39WKQ6_9PEZI|nr:Alpha/beta hydrolase family-domain-containing protein [Immersiella caudata]